MTEPILLAEIAGGVALYDVSHLLPRHKTKRYEMRTAPTLPVAFVHHSGALGRAGLDGVIASARYAIREPSEGRRKTVFPGLAYHYWVPYRAVHDEDGRLVVYLGNHETLRSWHTGGEANDGIGVCLQGNLTVRKISASQVECLEALLPWLGVGTTRALSWHSESGSYGGSGKPSCPGRSAEAWLTRYRDGLPSAVA